MDVWGGRGGGGEEGGRGGGGEGGGEGGGGEGDEGVVHDTANSIARPCFNESSQALDRCTLLWQRFINFF